MKIQHNITAMNAYQNQRKNQSGLAKNLQKLSSGYKIVRAGDDAAGLAVSEKMRAQITGMTRAQENVKEGVNLIRTAEGAMQEVHDMLNRLKELSVEAANGTYGDGEREKLQAELEQIRSEVGRIADATNFNGIRLFQDRGYKAETSTGAAAPLTLDEVLLDTGGRLKNIIYTDVVIEDEFVTQQSETGAANLFTGDDAALAGVLQNAIVPRAVQSILDTYTAFNYLTGSSIGIGLRLYSDGSSSTLASVGLSRGTVYRNSDGEYYTNTLSFRLSVNTAKTDISTEAGRSALERTICHEMIHAFMDEATTAGMAGYSVSDGNVGRFPKWFIEGMAQTASGPGNWMVGATLALSRYSTTAAISAALSKENTLLTNSDDDSANGARYGSGYLACMYLGAKAYEDVRGSAVSLGSSTGAAAAIAEGLSYVLDEIVQGGSLDDAISYFTDYSDASAFAAGFATDAEALSFAQSLLRTGWITTTTSGGVASGDLAASDLLADGDLSLSLFALNTGNQWVTNDYAGTGITVLSGGTTSIEGVSPEGAAYAGQINGASGTGVILQIGASARETLEVPKFYFSVKALGLDALDISTAAGAEDAIDKLDAMIDRVSTIRGAYGALQNRLEHTANNLAAGVENLTEAESRIRDTDMAEEMMAYTKNNILLQSAQSMLSQANQLPQSVLQLLQ